MRAIYRRIMESSSYNVKPTDIDKMTIAQVYLMATDSQDDELSYEDALELVAEHARKAGYGLSSR